MDSHMEHDDKLVELPIAEWPKLRDLYRVDWPKNMLGYSTVDTFIRWTTQRKEPIKHVSIYTLNGEWSDGTYLCIHRYQLFLYTVSPSIDRLSRAAELLDWTVGYRVCSVLHNHRPVVDKIMTSLNLTTSLDCWMHLYHMSWQEALNIDVNCPPGITLGPLRVEHAEKINAGWSYRHDGSVFLIKQMIELSPNVGAFDENGQLLAWCLRLQAGSHGVLQVDEKYLKQGLGALVCRAFTKIMGELELDSSACVFDHNIPSRRTFERIGFNIIERIYWINTTPTVENSWID